MAADSPPTAVGEGGPMTTATLGPRRAQPWQPPASHRPAGTRYPSLLLQAYRRLTPR